LLVSSLLIARGEGRQSSNTFQRDWQVDTNGLSYEVLIYSNSSDVPYLPPMLNHIKPQAPVCWVDGWGNYTNTIEWKFFLWMPPTNICRVALFDSKGQAIEKTDEGKMFGLSPTQEQIAVWDRAAGKKHGGAFSDWHLVFVPSHPGGPTIPTAGPIVFSLQPLFRVKEPGEYTLHLRLGLIQTKEDSSGQVYFPMVWMPEVTAKVQIRLEDIAPENLSPTGQTNSPTK
jgi:hypothetical protein